MFYLTVTTVRGARLCAKVRACKSPQGKRRRNIQAWTRVIFLSLLLLDTRRRSPSTKWRYYSILLASICSNQFFVEFAVAWNDKTCIQNFLIRLIVRWQNLALCFCLADMKLDKKVQFNGLEFLRKSIYYAKWSGIMGLNVWIYGYVIWLIWWPLVVMGSSKDITLGNELKSTFKWPWCIPKVLSTFKFGLKSFWIFLSIVNRCLTRGVPSDTFSLHNYLVTFMTFKKPIDLFTFFKNAWLQHEMYGQ